MAWQHACVLAIAVGLATGCAEHLNLLARGAGGGIRPDDFWPPPGATSLWTTEPSESTFGAIADRIARALRDGGYREVRWHPIGVQYAHGFAVTTRLEQISDDATPKPSRERWFALYPESSTLRWLEDAREPRLPAPGRYRVFLIALTDLPMGHSQRAARWNEQTVMAGPELPAMELPAARRLSPDYRIGVYVYEYESDSSDGNGAFIARDTKLPAAMHVRRSGLSTLGSGQ